MLDSTATMLGAFAQWTCTEAETELRTGDTLLLYSDGVTEDGEMKSLSSLGITEIGATGSPVPMQ